MQEVFAAREGKESRRVGGGRRKRANEQTRNEEGPSRSFVSPNQPSSPRPWRINIIYENEPGRRIRLILLRRALSVYRVAATRARARS